MAVGKGKAAGVAWNCDWDRYDMGEYRARALASLAEGKEATMVDPAYQTTQGKRELSQPPNYGSHCHVCSTSAKPSAKTSRWSKLDGFDS